jgi:hypothetical protein
MKKKVIKLTESELKNYIQKIIMEQSSDINIEGLKRERDRLKKELAKLEAQIISKPNVGGKRPHDKMVMDCLKEAGFKSIDTGGKYAVYMKKGDNLVTSQSDPTKFAVWGTNETHTEELVIGTSTNCQIIVATALGHLSGKR